MKTKNTIIAGVDEVGRGAWAGPLVAAAVIFKEPIEFELKDSKLLTAKRRQLLVKKIKKVAYWSIGLSSHFEIDKYGLQKANILAAQRAINNLPIKPSFVRLDMIKRFSHKLPFELIVRGDSKVLEIMAASIIAKEYRDNMMKEFDRHYGEYKFSTHKGYGTSLHQQKLDKYGISVLHRTSFIPVKKYITN